MPIIVLLLAFKFLTVPTFRENLIHRFGIIPKPPTSSIWIHCVSVGEFKAAIPLIERLLSNNPTAIINISTTTPTARQEVLNQFKGKVSHTYFPIDLPIIIRTYIKRLNPEICILLETEIWPNLIHHLHAKNIPILLINARLSHRSVKRYAKFAPNLATTTISKISSIATLNKASADRFIELGAAPARVTVAGNIKFESQAIINNTAVSEIRSIIGHRTAILFASTHKDEDEKILAAYSQLQNFKPLLIIVPRHPERFDELESLAQKNKISITRRSSNEVETQSQILLGDSMGEMLAYIQVAKIVFVGGSLNTTGGHNMLEPAAQSKPIIFGPNVFNFPDISTELLMEGAAMQVRDAPELFIKINYLLTNKATCSDLGTKAKNYYLSHQGALDRISGIIEEFL